MIIFTSTTDYFSGGNVYCKHLEEGHGAGRYAHVSSTV